MIRKSLVILTAILVSVTVVHSQVVVDPSIEVRPIKVMNAVNNGPKMAPASQKKGNFEAYKAAYFPYARLHDAPLYAPWTKCVDISCIFPDFEADETRAESYDFTLTDKLLSDIQATGTKVFYRLGQSIENASKKYDVFPPKDYKKWARICEHIIRHYNEGWSDGFHYNIEYWEIWNEPDLGFKAGRHLKKDSPTWNGTDKDYFIFYETVSKYLKAKFPELKIGGPALCEDNDWADNFLSYCSKHNVELDFFSYHLYAGSVEAFQRKNDLIHSLLDKYGYGDVPMILDEWNYLANWTDEFVYTTEVISSYVGAAFTSAVMQSSQDGPVNMLMYYDARPNTSFNGLFDQTTLATLPAYYSFYAWKKLREAGTQVFSSTSDLKNIYVTAAKGSDGKLFILITNYSNDKNIVAPQSFDLEVKNLKISEACSFVTDKYKLYTETPVQVVDNKINLTLSANSVTLIEIK